MKPSGRAGRIALSLLAVSFVACSGAPEREEAVVAEIDGIVIRNQLAYPVHDVMVEVPATGGFAGCGMILRRSQCSTSFPAAAYRRNPLVVRWTEYGESRATDEILLEPPAGASTGAGWWLEVVIFAPGQAGARLVSPPAP